MRSAVVLALLAVTGCDELFGINSFTPADAAPSDTFEVTGTYKLRFTVNAADFSPTLVEEAYAASQLTMTVRLADGATPPVTVNDDGTFSFPRATATQPYSLTVASPVQTIEYQLDTSQLALVESSFGRPNPDPVTLPTKIHFDLEPGPVPGSVVIGSTGMWTFTGPPGLSDTGVFDFDWSTAAPVNSQLGLLRGDLNDRLYFIDMATYPSPGFAAMYAYSAFPLTLTNGTTSVIMATTPPPVTPDLCTHVDALRPAAVERLQTALPDFAVASYDDWYLFVTPALTLEPGGGTWVAGYTEPTFTPTEADLSVQYTNPYPGTITLGSMAAAVYRNLQLGNATPLQIASGGRMWQPLTPGTTCVTSGVVLQSTIAIAGTPMFEGIPLDTDDKPISLDRANPVPVTWSEAASGPVGHVVVQLYEVTNDSGATAIHLVHRTVTLATSATLDPSLFEIGQTYLIGILNVSEFSNAANGDFSTITYPVANSLTLSHSFMVTGS